MTFRILGSGSSGGVPRIGGYWGACDPEEPKNRRRRCSLLVTAGGTNVLIDTSPDMREQLIDADVGWVDGVLFTHDHADQAHGIDDLRMCALNMMRRVDVYAGAETMETLTTRFGYCFQQVGSYPAILDGFTIDPEKPVTIEGEEGQPSITAIPVPLDHGDSATFGFRIGDLFYSPDVVGIPKSSEKYLDGLKVWIVDALRYTPHYTHSHLEQTLGWVEQFRPEQGILTNLHVDMDYQTLVKELPQGVVPAYDGMTITL